MNTQYVIETPALQHQQNALRVEFIPPQSRCVLKPKDDSTVMLRARWNWRTDQIKRVWGQFEDCSNGCDCASCPFARDERRRQEHRAPVGVVIRRDPIHHATWWLLPNAESGWDGYGYWYPSLRRLLYGWAIEIDQRQTDKWGEYWTVAHFTKQETT